MRPSQRIENTVAGAGLLLCLIVLVVVPDWAGAWEVFKEMIRIQIGVPR